MCYVTVKPALTICCRFIACSTELSVSISFGGKSWPVNPADMNLQTMSNDLCLGGIFDLGLGSNIGSGGGNPSWVVGDTFLVSLMDHICV